MASNFSNAEGIQAQGLASTPNIQLTPVGIPNFEQRFQQVGDAFANAYKQTKIADRVLGYSNTISEIASVDEEFEQVSNTLDSSGTVIDTEGNRKPYQSYLQEVSDKKLRAFYTFQEKYNDPFFQNDHFSLDVTSRISALSGEQKVREASLKQQTAELQLSQNIATLVNDNRLSTGDRLMAVGAALDKAPVSEAYRIKNKVEAGMQVVAASIREANLQIQSDIAKLAIEFADDPQGLADAREQYTNSDKYKNLITNLLADLDDIKNFEVRLGSEIDRLTDEVESDAIERSAVNALRAGDYKVQALKQHRSLLLHQEDAIISIAMTNSEDPVVAGYLQALPLLKDKASDDEKLAIDVTLKRVKEAKKAFASANGSYLNVDPDKVTDPVLKASILAGQQREQAANERAAIAEQKGLSELEFAIEDAVNEKGYLSNQKQAQLLRKGATPDMLNRAIKQGNALPFDVNQLTTALKGSATPSDIIRQYGIQDFSYSNSAQNALIKSYSEAFNLPSSIVNGIFRGASSPAEAADLSFALANQGNSLTVSAGKSVGVGNILVSYSGSSVTLRSPDLVANRMGLSNETIVRMLAAHEIQKNPNIIKGAQLTEEFKSKLTNRIEAFNQGFLNKEKQLETERRRFNPAEIAPLITPFKNVVLDFGPVANRQTDPSRQSKGTIAFMRGVDKELGALGLKNSGIRITSGFRGSIRGHHPRPAKGQIGTFHDDPSGVAIDVVSSVTDANLVGKQLYGLLLAQSKVVRSGQYEIGGVSHGRALPLFDLVHDIRKTGALPSQYRGSLSPSQVRFMVNWVRRANFLHEKNNKRSHLHLSGKADPSGTYEYYSSK